MTKEFEKESNKSIYIFFDIYFLKIKGQISKFESQFQIVYIFLNIPIAVMYIVALSGIISPPGANHWSLAYRTVGSIVSYNKQ